MSVKSFSFLRVPYDCQVDLCRRVRQMRLQQNVTQAELAEAIGVSICTYKNYEKRGELQLSAFIRLVGYFSRLSEIDHLMVASDVPESLFNYKEPRKRQRARRKNEA